MALTNAEKQARWREKHIGRRRNADRVATLLVRTNWPDGHVEEIAAALHPFFTTHGIAVLRRALKPMTREDNEAAIKEMLREERAQWRKEHPGQRITDAAVVEWRRERNRAAMKEEAEDWERDHPGQRYPDHHGGLSDREYTDLQRWERQRERRRRVTA
jgi:hypothetical protein